MNVDVTVEMEVHDGEGSLGRICRRSGGDQLELQRHGGRNAISRAASSFSEFLPALAAGWQHSVRVTAAAAATANNTADNLMFMSLALHREADCRQLVKSSQPVKVGSWGAALSVAGVCGGNLEKSTPSSSSSSSNETPFRFCSSRARNAPAKGIVLMSPVSTTR